MSDQDGTKRPRGRPREYESAVSVRIDAALHDDLSVSALRQDKPLADIVRQRLHASPSQSASSD